MSVVTWKVLGAPVNPSSVTRSLKLVSFALHLTGGDCVVSHQSFV